MSSQDIIDRIAALLESKRFRFTSEADLQAGIETALREAGIAFTREHHLSAADRLDFLAERIAIEVKVAGALSALTRQIHRYAQSAAIEGILVVTSKARLAALPTTLNGKPVRVVHLLGSCL